MIVIDTSAIVAIFRQEEDALLHANCIASDEEPLISAASVVEASLVLRGLKRNIPGETEAWLDDFLITAGVRVEPVTEHQAGLARAAHQRFGKGTGHAAALNYGDCFAYALALATGAPLLFKGNDFSHIDVMQALSRSA